MELEEAKKYSKIMIRTFDIQAPNINIRNVECLKKETVETLLQALENSIPKEVIREKINERQFELQQEYKDFKDDIRLNTLQELYYYKEKE